VDNFLEEGQFSTFFQAGAVTLIPIGCKRLITLFASGTNQNKSDELTISLTNPNHSLVVFKIEINKQTQPAIKASPPTGVIAPIQLKPGFTVALK
jgi:hypothetical protein